VKRLTQIDSELDQLRYFTLKLNDCYSTENIPADDPNMIKEYLKRASDFDWTNTTGTDGQERILAGGGLRSFYD